MNDSTTATKTREQNQTGGLAAEIRSQAADALSTATEKSKEAAASATDKVKHAAMSAAQIAGELASGAGQKAEGAVSSLAGGMASLAGTIREKAPHEGLLGKASSSVAGTLESGGRYLQQEGLSGMADDATNLIRRNPIPAVLIGVGIGFLIARSLPRR
jgi:hypothetical protein